MKRIISLGIASALFMLLLGPSAASGESTQICTNHSGGCIEASTIHFVTTEKLIFENPVLNVSCNSLMSGTRITGGLQSFGPVQFTITSLTFTSCTFGCSVSTQQLDNIYVLNEGLEVGRVTGGGNLLIEISCFGFFDCFYTWAAGLGEFLGALIKNVGGVGHLSLAPDMLWTKGTFCPEEQILEALYRSLSPLYLRT